MERDQFFAVLHDCEWKIKHGDQHSLRTRRCGKPSTHATAPSEPS